MSHYASKLHVVTLDRNRHWRRDCTRRDPKREPVKEAPISYSGTLVLELLGGLYLTSTRSDNNPSRGLLSLRDHDQRLLRAHYGRSEQLGSILEADILVRALADRGGWVSAGRFASRSTA